MVETNEQDREGLKFLYEEIKKEHGDLLRKEIRFIKKERKRRPRKNSLRIDSSIEGKILQKGKSGALEYTKVGLENYLKETYSDMKGRERFPRIKNLNRITPPGVPFDIPA